MLFQLLKLFKVEKFTARWPYFDDCRRDEAQVRRKASRQI